MTSRDSDLEIIWHAQLYWYCTCLRLRSDCCSEAWRARRATKYLVRCTSLGPSIRSTRTVRIGAADHDVGTSAMCVYVILPLFNQYSASSLGQEAGNRSIHTRAVIQ